MVFISVVCALPDHFDWNTGGAMLAASDPVSALAGMMEIGAEPRPITISSAESVMNDGCGVLSFAPFVQGGVRGRDH